MTQTKLEWKLIYSVVVAGKNARFAEAVMAKLFEKNGAAPLDQVRSWADIDKHLRKARSGNYNKIARCLAQLIKDCPDLATCEPHELEKFYGIGPKTSRFFILWTRPQARYAALDVHILRWMSNQGYNVPKATPQSMKRYRAIEELFLKEADARGVPPAKLDWAIWVEGSGWPERNEETALLVQPLNLK